MVSKSLKTKVRMFFWKVTHYSKYKKFKNMLKQDITPGSVKQGMKFGYYGCFYDQVKETKDHTNLLWEIRQKPLEQTIKNIKDQNTDTVLDISGELFDRDANNKLILREDADERLRQLFRRLRSEGILHLIKVLYPNDEPNLSENEPAIDLKESIRNSTMLVRRVAAEFKELANVKLGVIYFGGNYPYVGIEHYDIVGMDWYKRDAEYLFLPKEGLYERYIVSKLQPGQQIWVVPGGYLKQDPKPFINWISTKEEAYGVIPFIWNHPKYNGTMDSGDFNTDIHTNGMANIYRQAGLIVTGRV